MDDMVLTVRIHDEGAEGYWAEVPEFPGIFAAGATMDELRESFREAVELYADITIAHEDWGARTVEEMQVTLARA